MAESVRPPISIPTHAKDQGQRSLSSKVTVETDGQMDGGEGDCVMSNANAVSNYSHIKCCSNDATLYPGQVNNK